MSLKIDCDAIFSLAFEVFQLKFYQIEYNLFDLVLLPLDQHILRNNKQATRLHLRQQLRRTMHKERATTRRHIKRRPHREPMQVSILTERICEQPNLTILIFFPRLNNNLCLLNYLKKKYISSV